MARINIRNGVIESSISQPTRGTQFYITIGLQNKELFAGGPNSCEPEAEDLPPDVSVTGHLCDIKLDIIGDSGTIKELDRRNICVPVTSNIQRTFGITINETGEYTISVTVDPQGNDSPDQAQASLRVVEEGESEGPSTPGEGGNGGGPGGGGGDGGGGSQGNGALSNLVKLAGENPTGTLVLGGVTAFAISRSIGEVSE